MKRWAALGIPVAAAVGALLAFGCEPGGAEEGGGSTAKQVPSEAHQLLPDGSVPWVDEPITSEQLHARSDHPRTPAPETLPCRADQLTAVLSEWSQPGDGGEPGVGFEAVGGGLIGEVEIHNTSERECTLRGEAPTYLLADGRQVPIRYEHRISQEARQRVIVVPAGGRARLRLDWSGPFCEEVPRTLELAIELPDQGGTLRAAVQSAKTPACSGGEQVDAEARGGLYASGFSEAAPGPPIEGSPMDELVLTVSGPESARPGERITYQVVLANPTSEPIFLQPCPGYYLELFSPGDAYQPAVNAGQLYQLNCRPVDRVPPGESLRFQMVAEVPAGLTAGRELSVSWRLTLPRFAGGGQWGQFRVTITG